MNEHANHPGLTAVSCPLRLTINAQPCGTSSNGYACSATGGHCMPEPKRCAELRDDTKASRP
jgi:hypothetical protein